MRLPLSLNMMLFLRMIPALCCLMFPLAATQLFALTPINVRMLDATGDRTAIMLVVRNDQRETLELKSVSLNGQSLEALMQTDEKDKRGWGRQVDWFQARPKSIRPGQEAALYFGGIKRDLLQTRPEVTLETNAGNHRFRLPQPVLEQLRIARVAFGPELDEVTLLVRNDSANPVTLTEFYINGAKMQPADLAGREILPGMLSRVEFDLPRPLHYGEDVIFRVGAAGQPATAWIRAHPAKSVTYPFWGFYVQRDELARRNMSVYAGDKVAMNFYAMEIQKNNGVLPEKMHSRLAQQAGDFGRDPDAWAWYMHDDVGWGKPTPQNLVINSELIRQAGSEQLQIVCLPADTKRYAWLADAYLNYHYHATHQGRDPTVFSGYRDIDVLRDLNEPAPISYLVDTVGQNHRWITVAEQDMASYAIVGRGAVHPGWFLGPSLWEQGWSRGGGVDWLEVMPWRYQEGATANAQVWRRAGAAAGVFQALQDQLAASAKLPQTFRAEDMVEILPLLSADDMVMTVVLNRRMRSVYPRDFPDGSSAGGTVIQPRRDVVIRHPLPAWITPHNVLAYDPDRGVREVPFQAGQGNLQVKLDALDAASLLLISTSPQMTAELKASLTTVHEPSILGTPVRPDFVLDEQSIGAGRWDDPQASFRLPITLRGPLSAGSWVKVELPALNYQPLGPLGDFDPHTVKVYFDGKTLPADVDSFRPASKTSEPAWKVLAKDNDVKTHRQGDRVYLKGMLNDGSYGRVVLDTELEPGYDILEVEASYGGMVPLLSYSYLAGEGKASGTARIDPHFRENVFQEADTLIKTPSYADSASDTDRLPLIRLHWPAIARKHAKAEAQEDWQPTDVPGLGFQVRNQRATLGAVRQRKSRPAIYFRAPRSLAAGREATAYVYWDYRAYPRNDDPVLSAKPQDYQPAITGPVERAGLAALEADITQRAVQGLSAVTQTQAEGVWLEARAEDGTLLADVPLTSSGELSWRLPRPFVFPEDMDSLWLRVALTPTGNFLVELVEPSGLAELERLLQVEGPVETLAVASDGSWAMAGADQVYGFDLEGNIEWELPVGENRRQRTTHRSQGNVEQVEISPGGDMGLIWTFRRDEKTHNFADSLLRVVLPTGDVVEEIELHDQGSIARDDADHWAVPIRFVNEEQIRLVTDDNGKKKGRLLDVYTSELTDAPPTSNTNQRLLRQAGDFSLVNHRDQGKWQPWLYQSGQAGHAIKVPPYTLHLEVTANGMVAVAGTQGDVAVFAPETGEAPLWQTHRNSRIDAMAILEEDSLLVIAYKRYHRAWDWYCTPVVEFLDLESGERMGIAAGESFDDDGHYAPHLSFSVAGDVGVGLLGTPTGDVYLFAIPSVVDGAYSLNLRQ